MNQDIKTNKLSVSKIKKYKVMIKLIKNNEGIIFLVTLNAFAVIALTKFCFMADEAGILDIEFTLPLIVVFNIALYVSIYIDHRKESKKQSDFLKEVKKVENIDPEAQKKTLELLESKNLHISEQAIVKNVMQSIEGFNAVHKDNLIDLLLSSSKINHRYCKQTKQYFFKYIKE